MVRQVRYFPPAANASGPVPIASHQETTRNHDPTQPPRDNFPPLPHARRAQRAAAGHAGNLDPAQRRRGHLDPFDVVGHLIYGERADWMPRARMILEFGDSRTFEPFDMSGHIQVCRGKSLGELLDEFSQLRAANLADLKALHLRPEDLERRGSHPRWGQSRCLSCWPPGPLTI